MKATHQTKQLRTDTIETNDTAIHRVLLVSVTSIACTISSGYSIAAEIQWVKVDATGEYTLYYSNGSAHVDNGTTLAEYLIDFKKPRGTGKDLYLSSQQLYRFDCSTAAWKPESGNIYWSQNMGLGSIRIDPKPDQPMRTPNRPDALLEKMMDFACKKAKPPTRQPEAKKGDGWDSWLEATGNKTKVAASIDSSLIRTTGSPPAPVETVVKVCQHLVNKTGPGAPGIGSIFSIEYLSPVDASTVYGNMGPQGKLFPLKLHALYRDGEKYYHNGYVQKDAFGELKCIAAR